jgi:hypothetical protein
MAELWREVNGSLVPFSDSLDLNANHNGTYFLNLQGCVIRSQSGAPLTAVSMVNSVLIPAIQSNAVTIRSTDSVQYCVSVASPIVVDSVVGAVKPTWVNVSTSLPVNKGSISDKVKAQFVLPSATLKLNTTSTVGYPADLFLALSAHKSNGQVVSLALPAAQRRLEPGTGTITFDGAEVGQFLSQFSDGLPDSIQLSGAILVNPLDATDRNGHLSSTSFIKGSVSLAVPLNLGITSASYKDTVDFAVGDKGTSEKPGSDQLSNVNSARLHVEFENGLPVGISVKIQLLNALHQPVLLLPQSGQSFDVLPASVDDQGFAVSATNSSFIVDLNHAEAQQYIPAQYVGVDVHMATTNGGVVSFRTTDQVKVRLWTECSYEVKK